MINTLLVYAALGIFFLGLVYRVSNWFRYPVGAVRVPITSRILKVGRGMACTLLSLKVFTLLRVLLLDVLV